MCKGLALFLGSIFALVGLFGFVPNPVIGPGGIFETNAAHNIAHLLFGAALLGASASGENAAATTLKASGALYLLLAVIGFIAVSGNERSAMLLDVVHINRADNWLHLVLGLVLLGAGFARKGVVSAAPVS
jgi:uncharacterized protein DUF4383